MIRGAEALGARLERMKERLYRGAEETVAEAAQAVCAEAAARAPVDRFQRPWLRQRVMVRSNI